jgi:hypothetical protein
MNTTQNNNTDNRSTRLIRRFAAAAMLAAAPALIALSTATVSHADTPTVTPNVPSVSTPHVHQVFPGNDPFRDRPWYQTPRHHHHHNG